MPFFNNLSIKYKIISIAIVAVIGFGISFVVNFSVATKNSTNLLQLENIIYPTLEHSEKSQVRLDNVINLLDQSVALEEEDMVEEADAIIVSIQKSFKTIANLDKTKNNEIQTLRKELTTYYNIAKSITMGMLGGTLKPEQIQSKAQAMQAALKTLRGHLTLFQKNSKNAFANTIKTANETAQYSIMISAIIGAILIATLAGTAFLIANSITRNIEYVSDNLQEIANGNGDLTQRLHATNNDEVGQLVDHFNTFMDKLQNMVQELTGYSSHVSSAAEELSSIAKQSRDGIESQRSDAEQVATASNEMAATVVEVASNAAQAASAATSANIAANKGSTIVNKTISIINQLAADVGEGSTAVNQLQEDSQNIGTVLDVIRGIAEQTNLLALNAAIEAARAGEQGRGFAVVADEVRTLASRTQESTMEIQSMIENLQSSSGQAAGIMNRGQETSEHGVSEAANAGDALNEITDSVLIISNMNDQIASAAEEQSSVAAEIDQNIVSISRSADTNADNITQLAGAGSSLNDVAIQMQELIGQFKV